MARRWTTLLRMWETYHILNRVVDLFIHFSNDKWEARQLFYGTGGGLFPRHRLDLMLSTYCYLNPFMRSTRWTIAHHSFLWHFWSAPPRREMCLNNYSVPDCTFVKFDGSCFRRFSILIWLNFLWRSGRIELSHFGSFQIFNFISTSLFIQIRTLSQLWNP